MTRSDYFRPVRGGISGLCEEADDKSIWTVVIRTDIRHESYSSTWLCSIDRDHAEHCCSKESDCATAVNVAKIKRLPRFRAGVLVAENAPYAAKTPRLDSFFWRKNNTQELSAAESTAEAGE